MRPRAHLGEPHRVAFHKQLDAEDAEAAQRSGDLGRDVARALDRRRAHGLRLPGFHVVAVHLHMADGRAEMGCGASAPVGSAHRKLGDLEIERHLAFHDDARLAHAPGRQRLVPRFGRVLRPLQPALPLARGRHHRFHETRKADVRDGRLQLLERARERIRRARQLQLLRRELADALAVHGGVRGKRRGNDGRKAVLLDAQQFIGGDRLDLRHDEMRAFLLHQFPQRPGIRHIDHVEAMRHLLPRRIGVAVHRNGLDAQALQLDDDFLAELAGAQQHHLDGIGRQRRAYAHVSSSSLC